MEFQTIGDRVVNESGQVAVSYFQPITQRLRVGTREYSFIVHFNISMAWIEPEDVEAVLSVVKECCGGNRSRVYRLEHETHVKRWHGLLPGG